MPVARHLFKRFTNMLLNYVSDILLKNFSKLREYEIIRIKPVLIFTLSSIANESINCTCFSIISFL